MPEIGEDETYADRLAASSEITKNAWKATIQDMEGMAAELQEQGWQTTDLVADSTAPNPPSVGDSDRYGFIYVVADNLAAEFEPVFEEGHEQGGGFEQYEVYRSETSGRVFQVTVFYDEPTANAILLAGTYEIFQAQELMQAAFERNELFTYLQTLDGTVVGSFRHEGWEHFFPDAEQRLEQ